MAVVCRDRPACAYVGTVLALGALVVWAFPGSPTLRAATWALLIASGAGAIAGGIWRHRPDRPVVIGWSLIAGGIVIHASSVAGWMLVLARDDVGFPSLADAGFITGTLVMTVGAVILVRSRRTEILRTTLTDTLIISGGIGVSLWVLTVEPHVTDASLAPLVRLTALAYPLANVLLVGVVARLALSPGHAPIALHAMLFGLWLHVVVDIVYVLTNISGETLPWGWVDFAYLAALVLVGGAGLSGGTERPANTGSSTVTVGHIRFVTITVAAAAPLLLLAVGEAIGIDVDGPLLPLASAMLFALLIGRTWRLMSLATQVVEARGHERMSSLISNSDDAIVVIDDEHRIGFVSPALMRNWGWTELALVGRHVSVLFHEGAPKAVSMLIGDAVHGDGSAALDARWITGTGLVRNVDLVVADHRRDATIRGVVITARDVSHRVALEDRLRHEAAHDALTRTANRRTFESALSGVDVSMLGSVHVVFVDVDNFKQVNDTLGHSYGDALLEATAKRLNTRVRPTDLVARLGGDEFGVLLSSGSHEEASGAVGRLHEALREPFDLGNGERLKATFSIGWTTIDDVDARLALTRADLAMYEAKRTGKDRVVEFHQRLSTEAERSARIRSLLPSSIERNDLAVHYQPVVTLGGEFVTGFEALVRWEPDGLSPISPDEFVPIAEETGDIVDIGRWVLFRACHEAMDWVAADGSAPLVSVNVSTVQLEDDRFEHDVTRALVESGLPADRLQLELTETRLANDDVAGRFQALRALGVRLAIDDFGTGYCSLSYLQHFRVDTIKIDRAFVTGASEQSLLAGIVRLVDGLGATVVAEGVETQEDLDVLRSLGVPLGQGWLFGKPHPHRPGGLLPRSEAARADT